MGNWNKTLCLCEDLNELSLYFILSELRESFYMHNIHFLSQNQSVSFISFAQHKGEGCASLEADVMAVLRCSCGLDNERVELMNVRGLRDVQ